MIRVIVLLLCLLPFACAPTPTANHPTLTTDTELEAAIREARDSLDTFVTKLATSHVDRTFVALKVRFSPPGVISQDLWVSEVMYENDVFRGNIGDDIPTLRLEAGEGITIEKEDILDWMIVEDGKLIGGYTIRLAVQRMSPDEREQFLATIDYTIED